MIAIVNYGLGNVESILNMLKKIGIKKCILATTPSEIESADKIILPGVGAFDTGMELLEQSGLLDSINTHVLDKKKPILGICLGMQMLGNSSEEGKKKGLGYIDFVCKRFSFDDASIKVPHMGWDYVNITQPQNSMLINMLSDSRFYFVHSYYAVCSDSKDIVMTCTYEKPFVAGVNHGNIYGVQFHPEKSHKFGMKLLSNFAKEC